jgi:hypothetical protein
MTASGCADGYCSGGTCCNAPCDGPCEACGANGCVETPATDERCGGTGRLPNGKVFGMFLPSQIEWIVPADADAELRAEMEKRGFKFVDVATVEAEPKRGCGKRHPGGVYVVTKPTDAGERAEAILKELVESGAIKAEGAEVNGNFIRFVNPVEVDCKRFRGLKRWSLSPKAEAEAEMILEAVAG